MESFTILDVVKTQIHRYRVAITQEERQNILVYGDTPLLYFLARIPLTFLVTYVVIQKPIEEFRKTAFAKISNIPEGAETVPMAKRTIYPLATESGRKYIPIFTDTEEYRKSVYPQYLNKLFMEAYESYPSVYLHMLKDLQYDDVLINPGSQDLSMPKDLFESFMSKGIWKKPSVFAIQYL